MDAYNYARASKQGGRFRVGGGTVVPPKGRAGEATRSTGGASQELTQALNGAAQWSRDFSLLAKDIAALGKALQGARAGLADLGRLGTDISALGQAAGSASNALGDLKDLGADVGELATAAKDTSKVVSDLKSIFGLLRGAGAGVKGSARAAGGLANVASAIGCCCQERPSEMRVASLVVQAASVLVRTLPETGADVAIRPAPVRPHGPALGPTFHPSGHRSRHLPGLPTAPANSGATSNGKNQAKQIAGPGPSPNPHPSGQPVIVSPSASKANGQTKPAFSPIHPGHRPQNLDALKNTAEVAALLAIVAAMARVLAGAVVLALASDRRAKSASLGGDTARLIRLTRDVGAQQLSISPWSIKGTRDDGPAVQPSLRTLVAYRNERSVGTRWGQTNDPSALPGVQSPLAPDHPLQILMQVDGKAMAKILVKHLNAWMNTNRAAGAAFDAHASFSQVQLSAV